MTRAVIVATALLLALTACGQVEHEVDRDAWRADLAELGISNPDMADLEALYLTNLCMNDAHELGYYVSLSMSDLDVEQVNFRNACPDRLDTLADAIEQVRGAGAEHDAACSTPPEERPTGCG